MRAGRGRNEDIFQVFAGFAERAIISEHDVISLPALDAFGEAHTAKGRLHNRLENAHIDIAPSEFAAIGHDFKILAAKNPVCERRSRARNVGNGSLDIARDPLDFDKIVTGHFHANRGPHAGRDHVHSDLDRIPPGIHQTRHLQF